MKMHATSNNSFRAALCAALLFLGPVTAVTAVMTAGTAPAFAKKAQDKLWLLTEKGEREISIEVAETQEERALGLMFRTELPDTNGMLFPSDPPQEANMWMQNTYIPLDMVFIRADGVIQRIEAMTEPLSEKIISSNGPVLAVLELNGGAAARMGLKAGDRVRYPLFK